MTRVRLKGLNRTTVRLRSGREITYWYAWKGGPRLPGKPGDIAFYDDARFPGRAVLVLGEHAELVEDLPLDVARDLALDVRQAAAAVRAASGARRINYAAFGNVVPHVHVHLIPRYSGDVEEPRGGVRNVIPGKGAY